MQEHDYQSIRQMQADEPGPHPEPEGLRAR
jgi:hypothetical protein